MFIRRDRKSTRSGEARVYISLAHNVRERLPDGTSRPKPITFARLGREEDLVLRCMPRGPRRCTLRGTGRVARAA